MPGQATTPRTSRPSSQKAEHAGVKTRRRGEQLEAALLDAAWEELDSVGYAAMTMEGVAERAGTSRAVLYRRWRNRPELVIAAMRRHRPNLSGPVPDTGSLREDVLVLLRRMTTNLTAIGLETVNGLLGELLADPKLAAASQDQMLPLAANVMTAILGAARERGDVKRDVPPIVATLPTDLYRHHMFVRRSPPSDATLIAIVDDVFLPLVQAPGPAE